ncbi:hypothetical protein RFI_38205, partial [Reticulomyxa filosa]
LFAKHNIFICILQKKQKQIEKVKKLHYTGHPKIEKKIGLQKRPNDQIEQWNITFVIHLYKFKQHKKSTETIFRKSKHKYSIT